MVKNNNFFSTTTFRTTFFNNMAILTFYQNAVVGVQAEADVADFTLTSVDKLYYHFDCDPGDSSLWDKIFADVKYQTVDNAQATVEGDGQGGYLHRYKHYSGSPDFREDDLRSQVALLVNWFMMNQVQQLVTTADALLPSITTNTTDATNGTYENLTATYTGLTATTQGRGKGAVFTAVVSTGAVSSITVTTAGSGYKVGDVLTILKSDIGSSTDLKITLQADDIFTVAPTGNLDNNVTVNPVIDNFNVEKLNTNANLLNSITTNTSGATDGIFVDLTATGGSGSGAVFTATVASGLVSSITVTSAGSGYKVGEELTIDKTQFINSASDLVILLGSNDVIADDDQFLIQSETWGDMLIDYTGRMTDNQLNLIIDHVGSRGRLKDNFDGANSLVKNNLQKPLNENGTTDPDTVISVVITYEVKIIVVDNYNISSRTAGSEVTNTNDGLSGNETGALDSAIGEGLPRVTIQQGEETLFSAKTFPFSKGQDINGNQPTDGSATVDASNALNIGVADCLRFRKTYVVTTATAP